MTTIAVAGRCANHRMVWLRRAEGHQHSKCDRPVWAGCETCGERALWRCGASSELACKPCAKTYRQRVGRVAVSGRLYPGGTVLLLTLTAPGDQLHHLPGGKVCPCTPAGGVDLAEWNAGLGARWNRFCQELRRDLDQPVQYFKATEVQERGALHLHVPIRLERGTRLKVGQVRRLALKHGFGHSVDLRVVKSERGVWYVAKYVAKASALRPIVPWRKVDPITGEVARGASYRCWTASRAWGLTMAEVKAEQRDWCRAARGGGGGAPAPEPPLDSDTTRYTDDHHPVGVGVAA